MVEVIGIECNFGTEEFLVCVVGGFTLDNETGSSVVRILSLSRPWSSSLLLSSVSIEMRRRLAGGVGKSPWSFESESLLLDAESLAILSKACNRAMGDQVRVLCCNVLARKLFYSMHARPKKIPARIIILFSPIGKPSRSRIVPGINTAYCRRWIPGSFSLFLSSL